MSCITDGVMATFVAWLWTKLHVLLVLDARWKWLFAVVCGIYTCLNSCLVPKVCTIWELST